MLLLYLSLSSALTLVFLIILFTLHVILPHTFYCFSVLLDLSSFVLLLIFYVQCVEQLWLLVFFLVSTSLNVNQFLLSVQIFIVNILFVCLVSNNFEKKQHKIRIKFMFLSYLIHTTHTKITYKPTLTNAKTKMLSLIEFLYKNIS